MPRLFPEGEKCPFTWVFRNWTVQDESKLLPSPRIVHYPVDRGYNGFTKGLLLIEQPLIHRIPGVAYLAFSLSHEENGGHAHGHKVSILVLSLR